MALRRWLRILTFRACHWCWGRGYVNLSEIVDLDPVSCSVCHGTGIAWIARAEMRRTKALDDVEGRPSR